MIPGYVPPLWEYTYETGGRSATVGLIYRHDDAGGFSALIQDKLFVFDWARRWIKYGELVNAYFENDAEADVRIAPPSIRMPAKRLANIKTFDPLSGTAPISIEQGPDGSIYVAEFDGFWDAGPDAKVTRYSWVEGNRAPLGDASITPDTGHPMQFRFDGSRSNDPDAEPIAFHWDLGGGQESTQPVALHTYSNPGSYAVRLTVTDASGASARVMEEVQAPFSRLADHASTSQR